MDVRVQLDVQLDIDLDQALLQLFQLVCYLGQRWSDSASVKAVLSTAPYGPTLTRQSKAA